jgi:hypothetical protein
MAEFSRAYPDDPELRRLVVAFDSGDYFTVRQGAPELAQRTTDEAVRKAALDLRRRIEPAPEQLYLFARGLGLPSQALMP